MKKPVLLLNLALVALIIQTNFSYESPRHSPSHGIQQLTPPSFPGGAGDLNTYMFRDLPVPKDAKGRPAEAAMIVSFYVEKDGSLEGFMIEQTLNPEFDAKVIDLLKKSPKWTPAMRGDVPIKAKYKLPIRFHADNGADKMDVTKQ